MAFTALVYKDDLEKMKEFVTHYPNVETGGDLFGLWQNEETVVIQFFIGPGKGCKRTSTSFHQDVKYLGRIGSMLIAKDGLCNVGEWHSHHQIGMPQPSSGDKSTVLNNMPQLGLQRFVLFIAHIETSSQGKRKSSIKIENVEINCFMFKQNMDRSKQPIQGKMKIIDGNNPFNEKVPKHEIQNGAEQTPGEMNDQKWKKQQRSARSFNQGVNENQSPNARDGIASTEKNKGGDKKNGGKSPVVVEAHGNGLF